MFTNNVDVTTNRLAGPNICYDPDGNLVSDQNGGGCGNPNYAYDIGNRMISAKVSGGGTEYYQYSADNKRISTVTSSGSQRIFIYGAMGEKISVIANGTISNNVYFFGRLIKQNTDPIVYSVPGPPLASPYPDDNFVGVDRLGTVRAFLPGPATTSILPYGEELTATPNDQIKFATYTRDGSTGLDYADQRYFTSTWGRFMSADRFQRAAKVNDSGSWNKYSYVHDDPVNKTDHTGQVADDDGCDWDSSTNTLSCSGGGDPGPGSPIGTPGTGGGSGTGVGGVDYNSLVYNFAASLRDAVAKGVIANDCIGLADFAQGAAAFSTSSAQFENASSVFVPPATFESLTGVAWNTDPIRLGGHDGETSGFATQYQDGFGSSAGTNNTDQAHHFAAFFQLGYNLPPGMSMAGAYVQEWYQGTLDNQGDINLAIAAASLGYAVRNGSLKPSQVAGAIQDTICNH